jgi:hypothetical protein
MCGRRGPDVSTPHDGSAGEDQRQKDAIALRLRSHGRSYGGIAKQLGWDRTWLAVAAFNRALRRQSPEEQDRLRQQESAKLTKLTASVEQSDNLDEKARQRRLAAVDRLRTALFSTSGEITPRSRAV